MYQAISYASQAREMQTFNTNTTYLPHVQEHKESPKAA
jgi:hypothetical protein